MVNIRKLRAAMVERDFTVSSLSDAMKIDKSTLYRRFANNGQDITMSEANAIKDILNLSVQEAHDIFFADEVAHMPHGG